MVSMKKERKRDMDNNREKLRDVIRKENREDIMIQEYVREGIPAEVILTLIEEENIDLLILRSQTETRLERLLVGGSNDEIIRAMPCSIYLVKEESCALDEETETEEEDDDDD